MVLPPINHANADNRRMFQAQIDRLTELMENREINRDHFIRISNLVSEYARANQYMPRHQIHTQLNALIDNDLQTITTMSPYSFS